MVAAAELCPKHRFLISAPIRLWALVTAFGLVWLVTLMTQVARFGLIEANRRRLMWLSMFWHVLDVVWIAIFTFVYLVGIQP